MQASEKLRYYQANPPRRLPSISAAPHSEFLRTGRIARPAPPWAGVGGKRYLTREEVAERTGRKLTRAGETTHQRINAFHEAIRFPKLIFYRVFDEIPHLGYCHVTTSTTSFGQRGPIHWSFYIANFSSDISETYPFFENIRSGYSRMYFAVAYEKAPGETLRIDRSLRKDGLLFRTDDPHEAMKNVLLLGARNQSIRAMIKKL
ncbi:hypothetical protein REJC140_01927 [Pseudorhizobium endolithicum]|uniref:Uncharacterized protein n=1 Tax=Pseudorhizobium endolithicum TaxID=1191678 RepID=A0ABN7JX98_9HYPH|nr:DUF6656 family protein [Pseudorhizobium endolithicum]CAD7052940.1 hypothetical protein REJC140_01927 [Pseudorhizobium endolithicum]